MGISLYLEGQLWGALTLDAFEGAVFDDQAADKLTHSAFLAEAVVRMHRLDKPLIAAVEAGAQPLDLLCVEGSLITGPYGSGMFDSYRGRPKIRIVEALAARARVVVAIGTCAAFGGIPAAPPNPTDCTGLQFHREQPGGMLPPEWRSAAGLPVINLAGCPTHPATITHSLTMIAQGQPLELLRLLRQAPVLPAHRTRHRLGDAQRRIGEETAARIAAISTSTGTPVKSCRITRDGINGSSTSAGFLAFQVAMRRTSSSVTVKPSQLRSSDSHSTRIENGRRSKSGFSERSASSR